jgi:hypothetical protein
VNFSLNSSLLDSSSPCYISGKLKAECVIKQFCPQFPAYFFNVAIILLISYFLIDFLIPFIFIRLNKGLLLQRFYIDNPGLARYDLRPLENQRAFIAWLKDRLLFAFALLAAWLAYFSFIFK